MKVRIYRPSKSTMQSGRSGARGWILECEAETRRRPEPLMGWTASGDTNNQIRLKFSSAEDAMAHAHKNGWDYTVDLPHERTIRPRNYTDNFRYIPPADGATK